MAFLPPLFLLPLLALLLLTVVLVRAARESKCKIGTKLLLQVTGLILVYFLCGSYIGAGNYAKDNFEFKLILFYFFD